MSEQYARPRWGWLFLILPLAAGLFWLVSRGRVATPGRELLELGVLLLIGVYFEVWRRWNLGRLLRHPASGSVRTLFRVVEAVPARPSRATAANSRPLGTFYSDLFSGPVSVADRQPVLFSAETRAEEDNRP